MILLLRAQARRDRLQLLIWILGTGLLGVGSAASVLREFGTGSERKALLELVSNTPALIAVRGIPDGTSSGAVIFFEIFTFLAVMAALMSTFLTVRHSRGDEERGRSELIGSTPVARGTALAATLTLGVLANLLLGALIAAGFVAAGLPRTGSLLSGAAIAGTGIAFCGIAALAAQLARTSRAANSIAGALVAVAYLLRAVGDALGSASADRLHVTSAWPSWLSPIGWGEQLHPFAASTAIPLLLFPLLAIVTGGAALVVASRRDLGAGLIGERPGRPSGGSALRGPFGLAWRLQRSAVIGWSVGAAILGLLAGGLADPAVAAVKANANFGTTVKQLIPASHASLIDTFVAVIMIFLGVLAAAAALQSVLRARQEEADGRSELLVAGSIGRSRPMLAALAVSGLTLVIVCLVGGLVTGLAFAAAGHPDRFWISLGAAMVQLPAAAVFTAVGALIFAVLPRATIPAGWTLLAIGFVLGEFGGLLRFPQWIRDISPFSHTPVVPASDVDALPLVVMAALAVVLAVGSVVLVRRRDAVS